jgi:hypothetical protein
MSNLRDFTGKNRVFKGTLNMNDTGGIATDQTTIPLFNSTATTVNFAGAATSLSIGNTTGSTVVNNQFKIGSNAAMDARITATLSNTTQTSVDTTSTATSKSIKYLVQATYSTSYQISEILIVTDGTVANLVEYGIVHTSASPLVSFDADISSGDARLLATAATATTTLKIIKTTVV